MINLLPTDVKEDLIYARRNRRLLGWVMAACIALLGVTVIVGGGALYIQHTIGQSQVEADAARATLASQNPKQTQKQLEEISNNTKLAIQVLSQEILFSKLLRQLGASVPANTVLQDLKLSKAEGAITIKAVATDINTATQLQINLQDPNNKIFEKADIESISCIPDPKNKYPCTVQIKALFAKNNPFAYITTSATTGSSQ